MMTFELEELNVTERCLHHLVRYIRHFVHMLLTIYCKAHLWRGVEQCAIVVIGLTTDFRIKNMFYSCEIHEQNIQ